MKVLNPVSLIITNDENEILLVKPKEEMEGFEESWCLPGGFPEVSESYEAALLRAVRSELRCRLRDFDYYKSTYFKYSQDLHYRSVYYHGRVDGDILLSDKLSDSQWFSVSEIKKSDMNIAADQKEAIVNYFAEIKALKSKASKNSLFNI